MKAQQIGPVEIVRVEEMIWEMDKDYLFPDVSEAELAPHLDWLTPRFFTADGKIRLSVHAFVVRTPHHVIVVDTCVGNDKPREAYPDLSGLQLPFLERLKDQAGITPEDVDYVFCTHFHLDHVGWNTTLVDGRWAPTFPNARYLFHRPEFEHYTGLPAGEQQPSLHDSVLPIAEAGRADLVDGEHRIGDHLVLEPTPGHTPGHCSVRIEAPQARGVITGDMMHSPVQVIETRWRPSSDYEPEQAIETRRDFIARHAEAGSLVLATHFAPPTACRFEQTRDGHRPDFGE